MMKQDSVWRILDNSTRTNEGIHIGPVSVSSTCTCTITEYDYTNYNNHPNNTNNLMPIFNRVY